MASQKLTALTALTTPDPADLTYIVDDVAGTPVERKITLADLARGFRTVVCSGQSLTGSQATSLVDLAATWNTTGTPTAILLNVTDTASNASSLLMDLRVGGVSILSVGKAAVNVPAGASQVPGLRLGTGTNGFASISNTEITGVVGGSNVMRLQSSGCIFSSPIGVGGGFNLYLHNDAANTLALRNAANAQTFRVYGTFTDASNHRRLVATMSTAGVAEIRPEGAGTGASGNVLHISGLPTSNPGPGILWNNGGTPAIGT
jgi:hypothetical protein